MSPWKAAVQLAWSFIREGGMPGELPVSPFAVEARVEEHEGGPALDAVAPLDGCGP
jgi:hypothetical protein